MRPPDIDSLPPVARSGMEPAPGRGPFVAYKPFWNVGSIAAAIVVFAVWATLAADELSNGKGSVRAIGVLAVAHLFGWLWIATRFYLEESPSGVRRLEHEAADAIPQDEIDRVVIHELADADWSGVSARWRTLNDAHWNAGRVYESDFWARVSRRAAEIVDGKPRRVS